VSPSAGEIVSELSLGLHKGATLTDLASTIHPYPSYSWALQLMAADVYSSKLAKLYKAIPNPLKALRRRKATTPDDSP
jgi:hypothetical protein